MMRAAHRTIRGPDPRRASLALAGVRRGRGDLLASALFDVLSFPHVPYLLFFIGAMIVALREPSPANEPVRLRAARPREDAGPGGAGGGLDLSPLPADAPHVPPRERELVPA